MKIISNDEYNLMEIKKTQQELTITSLRQEIEQLKKENEKITKDFTSNHKYVITGDDFGINKFAHLYINGAEALIRRGFEFEATHEGFNIQIYD